jgi:valyl-tRNA synthetase
MTQFRRIGASLDYRRERFTMDDDYVRAVMRFFVHLYGKGWIYRANRIINWCPFHETSLSDLELVARGGRRRALVRPLSVRRRRRRRSRSRPRGRRRSRATSRSPSTRTTSATATPSARGRRPVRRAARAGDRRRARRPEFGTGALKVTPGHDPLDFEIGRATACPSRW